MTRVAWKIIIVVKPDLDKSFIVLLYRGEKIRSLLHLLKQVGFCFLVSEHTLQFFLLFFPWDRQFNSGMI